MLLSALKGFAMLLYRAHVPLPASVQTRLYARDQYVKSQALCSAIFADCELKWSDKGFWVVDPMPSPVQLDHYYKTSYWATRDDRQTWLRHRDISHFRQIEPHIRSLVDNGKKPLAANFGAGHGGVSFLLSALGFSVTHIDPYPGDLPIFQYSSRLDSIGSKVDLVYGSHSFEHVTDVVSTFDQVLSCLNVGGFLFVEVPNALSPFYSSVGADNARIPRIQPPHTVYFTEQYFRNLGLEVLSLETYKYEGDPWGSQVREGNGEVIRFLGRKLA
jgi:hypothetical protein